MYNNPAYRSQLNQQEKLLGAMVCGGSEEDYLATLRGARLATLLWGSAKFLLPAKVAPPGNPLNPPPGTPKGGHKCTVCKNDFHGDPTRCRERCHTCKGNPPPSSSDTLGHVIDFLPFVPQHVLLCFGSTPAVKRGVAVYPYHGPARNWTRWKCEGKTSVTSSHRFDVSFSSNHRPTDHTGSQ